VTYLSSLPSSAGSASASVSARRSATSASAALSHLRCGDPEVLLSPDQAPVRISGCGHPLPFLGGEPCVEMQKTEERRLFALCVGSHVKWVRCLPTLVKPDFSP
jgi:hypothetical protein